MFLYSLKVLNQKSTLADMSYQVFLPYIQRLDLHMYVQLYLMQIRCVFAKFCARLFGRLMPSWDQLDW